MKHIKSDFRSKACDSPTEWTCGVGSKGQNSTLSEHGHVAYQIKENHKCSNKVANILPRDPLPKPPNRPTPLTLGMRSIGHILPFTEHGHVAYAVQGNHEMKQHGSKYFSCSPLADPEPKERIRS